jgi:MT0933-like antitoxin protein
MGLMDRVKGLVGDHKEQVEQGIDNAARIADEKTGGSHSDQIRSAADKGKEEVDKLGEGGPSTPAP